MPDDKIWTFPTQQNASGDGPPGATSSDPGDTVGWLWEEPADLAMGHVVVRLILGNPNAASAPWSGANAYLSYDDVSYGMLAATSQRSIIGELDTELASGSGNWQPAATVDVDISASPGTLITTSEEACQSGVNLCIIGDEVCSFVDAELISANVYRLTGFKRAWYGTTKVTHAASTRFAMLSPLQSRVELPLSMAEYSDWLATPAVGLTWYWKAASLNIARREQSLADATAYTITLVGSGLSTTLDSLRLRDTNQDFDLVIVTGSNLSAERTLTINPGDADRTITLQGDPTLADWFDQAVKVASSPTFAQLTLTTGLLTPQIGPAGDPDLLGLAANVLTVNGNIYIDKPSDPSLYLREGGSATSYTRLWDASAAQMRLDKVTASGAPGLHLNPIASDGSSAQTVRVFRDSDPGGAGFFNIYEPGTSTVRFQVVANSGLIQTDSNLRVDGGNIGLTADTDLLGLAANVLTVNGAAVVTGDLYWTGDGSGLPFGSCYGNEIGWLQVAAQDTWYNVSDADMITGELNTITHDGSGKLTVTLAGRYLIHWAASMASPSANKHILVGIEISNSGTAEADGQQHHETSAAAQEFSIAGHLIADLAANDTIEFAVSTTDAGNPTINVEHLNLSAVQIGGT